VNVVFFIVCIVIYAFAARMAVTRLSGKSRDIVFAVLNIAGVYLLLFFGTSNRASVRFITYVLLVVFQYAMLCVYSERKDWKPWLAFFAPVAALIFIRYIPWSMYSGVAQKFGFSAMPTFVGLSYLAFRSSYLVLEVRNGIVTKPGFWAYLGFCFFLPTMSVGPINPFSNFCKAFADVPPLFPWGRAALRIIVGLVKLQFLGTICSRLSYSGLLDDNHYHHWIDLPVAMICYYLYLYFNFSGACDIAIGVAGLIGIPVVENFNNPFAARNVKDFWNRWHITLSQYMRDVVFSPLSKALVRRFGPSNANHAIALTITVVFLLVGIWHGVGWNFAAYGAAHALAVVVNHYYTIGLKKWLGRDGFKAYNNSRGIHAVAVVLTFCYCAATLFLFANTFPEMKGIFASLR